MSVGKIEQIESHHSRVSTALDVGSSEQGAPATLMGRWLRRLGTTELRRRIWHMTPGLLPVLLWPIPHADPLSPTLLVLLFALIGGIATAIFVHYRSIERIPGCEQGRDCVLAYSGTILFAIVLFPSALEIPMAIAAILAFGDGSATLFGKIIGGPALPWNREKTWSGFCGFLLIGIPAATWIYYCEAHNVEALGPPLPLLSALACCAVTVFAAAIAESAESRIDDNLRVGMTSLAVLPMMHALLVGWH